MERAVGVRQVQRVESNEAKKDNPSPKYEMVPDGDFESLKTKDDVIKLYHEEGEAAVERLAKFISDKMEYMNNKLTFADAGISQPTPYEIEVALSTWLQTSFSINSMYELAQADADNAVAEYEMFLNIKKTETRNKFNTIDLKKASWLSATEIESVTFSIYRKELAQLKAKQIELNREASTLHSLQKSWDNYLWVLRTLQSMAIAEMNGSKFTVDMKRGDETDC